MFLWILFFTFLNSNGFLIQNLHSDVLKNCQWSSVYHVSTYIGKIYIKNLNDLFVYLYCILLLWWFLILFINVTLMFLMDGCFQLISYNTYSCFYDDINFHWLDNDVLFERQSNDIDLCSFTNLV